MRSRKLVLLTDAALEVLSCVDGFKKINRILKHPDKFMNSTGCEMPFIYGGWYPIRAFL